MTPSNERVAQATRCCPCKVAPLHSELLAEMHEPPFLTPRPPEGLTWSLTSPEAYLEPRPPEP